MATWQSKAVRFLNSLHDAETGGSRSTPEGPPTLYGTCYSKLAELYLGRPFALSQKTVSFILDGQDSSSGLFLGPELTDFSAETGVKHDAFHLQLHLTCTVLPVLQELQIAPKHPVYAAHRFCDLQELTRWLDARDLRSAWFEGNNLLFVGQLLVYLRDIEGRSDAAPALDLWFDWLDAHTDPDTGLWGSDGYCSAMEAVYGGYHQLLVYYHENRPLSNLQGLVDTVLALQHVDGGFNPGGNAGACEDVDSVDILVNCYKLRDYRRVEIRLALRQCLRHILRTQNADGGFPYNRSNPQSHMGIPGTTAGPNVSCTFPTWFRVHTLALIAEVLPNEPALTGVPFRFSSALSMGWHSSPPGWRVVDDNISSHERLLELRRSLRSFKSYSKRFARKGLALGRGVIRAAAIKK